MIIRLSFLVVASVAALKISNTKTSSSTKRNVTVKSSGGDGSHLENEFEEREDSSANANHGTQNEEENQIKIEISQNLQTGDSEDFELLIGGGKMDNVTEKELLRNLVQNCKQREVNLKRKLLKLNGLKEEQSAIAELQRQLEKKTAKLDSLKLTVSSMQAESKIIQEKIREGVLSKKELDIANKMINEMQGKNNVNGSPFKEQILMLQHQVAELQKYNSSGRNAILNKKRKDVRDVEIEVLELKRRNKEHELEKREQRVKLAAAHARIRTEEKKVAKIKEDITCFRRVHEELSELVESLQRNRFDIVEELVYQRWLFACLRFEIHNHKRQSRKASRRYCSQNSSKELYRKAQSLTSDTEPGSISSIATLDESDGTQTTTLGSSSSSQSSSSKNSSFLIKMKRWRKIKDDSEGISSIGRNSSNSLEKPIMPRLKSLSFSDSVKPSACQDMPEAVEDVIHDKGKRSGVMELTSSNMSCGKHEAEQYDKPNNSNDENAVGNPINNATTAENEGTKNKVDHSDAVYSRDDLVCRKHDRIKTQLVQLVAFFFFSLILLGYFRFK